MITYEFPDNWPRSGSIFVIAYGGPTIEDTFRA